MSLQSTGKLNLRQIEKQSLDLELIPAEQKWLLRAFQAAAPLSELTGLSPEEWASKVEFDGQLSLSALKPDYLLKGSFEAKVPSACSRCLEPFMADRKGEFQIFIKRLERGDSKEPSDDPDYWMINSDELDLGPIIAEQLVVLEPIAESQHHDTYGELTCTDPQLSVGAGDFEQEAKPSPFAALAGLKLKTDKN
jgi:uncharacterized metal-binding protein YceD (DUF177 family)